ncbi:hypothetical protein [Massilia sp. CF038]|uniref:hypothetical protein n=1 Tax=Massilia sp. CF038 TaxID=1881045 RepID=UPI0009230C88|nr:hypothetical protein [Massilia sp. CF038]SHH25032.1 hypothetical protein SAMN05428948_3513 [Massilia sp. CF038]
MTIYRTALLSMLLISIGASAAPGGIIPNGTMTTKEEKKDMLVRFERAAVASVVSEEKADGLVGYTSEFGGSPKTVFIAFDDSVPEDKLFSLMNFQGKLHGAVQCKRVRLGNSPQFPAAQLGVVAEQCQIKSLNH